MTINFTSIDKDGIILIVKPYDRIINEDLNLYIHHFDEYLNKKNKFRCIFDLRNISDVPIEIIYKLSKYMKRTREKTKKKLSRCVILINSALVRNLLNLLFTIIEPVSPYLVTNSIEKMEEFLIDIKDEREEKVTAIPLSSAVSST